MKETAFIEIIKNTLSSSEYIGDDTAYIKERDLITTVDTLIENVHFRRSTITPYNLGIKSVAVNLSDIAASGGVPEFILVSLSMPFDIEEEFVREFYKGINDICNKYGVKVIGGDITGSDKVCISITAIGKSQGINPANRKNAKIDQLVVVTGNHGSSAAGLWLLENNTGVESLIKDKFIKTHSNPEPQVHLGQTISKACRPSPTIMDSSDGLADALYKISKMSGVSMVIDASKIPFDKDLIKIAKEANIDPLKWVLFGGEDYQLVAVIEEEQYKQLKEKNPDIYIIGKTIVAKEDSIVTVKTDDNEFVITQQSLDNYGFDHFGAE